MLFLFLLIFTTLNAFAESVINVSNDVVYNLNFDTQDENRDLSEDVFLVVRENLRLIKSLNLSDENIIKEYELRCSISKDEFYSSSCELFNYVLNRAIFSKIYFYKDKYETANNISNDVVFAILKKKYNFNAKIGYVARSGELSSSFRVVKISGGEDVELFSESGLIVKPIYSKATNQIFYNLLDSSGNLTFKIFDISGNKFINPYSIFPDLRNKNIVSISLSQDESLMAFSALNREKGTTELFYMDMRSKKIKLLKDSGINVSPCFLNDNKTIVYVSDKTKKPTLYTLEVDSFFNLSSKLFESNLGGLYEPACGTNNVVVFTEMKSKNFSIYAYDKNNDGLFLVSTEYKTQMPSWSKDGMFLLYSFVLSEKDNKFKIRILPYLSNFNAFKTIFTEFSAEYPIFLD